MALATSTSRVRLTRGHVNDSAESQSNTKCMRGNSEGMGSLVGRCCCGQGGRRFSRQLRIEPSLCSSLIDSVPAREPGLTATVTASVTVSAAVAVTYTAHRYWIWKGVVPLEAGSKVVAALSPLRELMRTI